MKTTIACASLVIGILFSLQTASAQDALPAPTTPTENSATGEQSNRIVVITTYLTTPSKLHKLEMAAKEVSLTLEILAAESINDSMDLQEQLRDCNLLLIDVPHDSVVETLVQKCSQPIAESKVPYVVLSDLEAVTKGSQANVGLLEKERNLPALLGQRIREYWRFGGKGNTSALMKLLSSRDLDTVDLASLPPAQPLADQGAYHPAWPEIVSDLNSVQSLLSQRSPKNPSVAIAINRAVLTSEDLEWLDMLINKLDERGINAYAFYGPRQNPKLFHQMTCADGKAIVGAIINAALVFRSNERKAELEEIGVPVLQTIPSLSVSREEWQQSPTGLSLLDISYYYASTELAGMIDPILITALDQKSGSMLPIEPQLQSVVDKVAMLCRIQSTPRSDRKLAIMVYNYPAGASNFGASFLNVPRSIVNILRGLKDHGYQTDVASEESLTRSIQTGLTTFYAEPASQFPSQEHAARLPLSEYLDWFQSLPPSSQKRIVDYWGAPSKSAVMENGQPVFLIPRTQVGNVTIIPQPPRFEISNVEDTALRKKRIGHRSSVPVSHQYLATYRWLRESFGADSVVHLGTHGTVEWLPGKERGLSVEDDPYLALGDLNNVYPYIMDNLGEATTAKRRGRAVTISHLTPLFTPAGFRPGLHEMHDLMHDWENAGEGSIKQTMEKRLIELFVEHRLDRDLNWPPADIASRFAEFMEKLHPYLDDIAQSAQPLGLATFGEIPIESRRLGMVMQMIRKPLIEDLGEDIDEVFLLDSEKVLNSRPARWLRLAISDPQAASIVDLRKIDALQLSTPSSVPNRSADKALDSASLLELGKRAQSLYNALSQNQEMASLMDALDAKYVKSSYGGDPVRNPESLPTGRNLYGFDPSRVPTRQAWELGKQVFDDWLVDRNETSAAIEKETQTDAPEFPQKVAFSLWAGETMRHQGVMEAQVLYALGVQPKWDDAGRVLGVETISSSELGRPRIDVVLSVTGSYRDQFPLLMQWIDQAVHDVASLDEPNNQVYESTNEIVKQLTAEGVDADEAKNLASLRIFSNEPGVYGTGVNDAVAATDLWETQKASGGDNEIAQLFIDRMGFAYGAGQNVIDTKKAANLFAKQLQRVDTAFASRSSNTYGVLTSDDAFAYVGGISIAARILSGKTPELYVQNLRDESEVIVDNAATAIAKEMQSRYLHPEWIRSQQAEGYSGTLQVLKTAQFLWGWQVTDPSSVREDQWQSLVEVYLDDKYDLGTINWLSNENPAAFAQMIERLLDATRLGYWQPDAATTQKLIDNYEQLRAKSNLLDSNRAVEQFVSARKTILPDQTTDAAASGEPSSGATSSDSASEPEPNAQQRVSGLELQVSSDRSNQTTPERPKPLLLAVLVIFLCMGLGAIREYYRTRNS